MKALNVKIALLTCVGFTVAMCWLVSQVSRPISSAVAASAGGGAGGRLPEAGSAGASPAVATTARPGKAADGLRRSNPIDASRLANRGSHEAAPVRGTTLITDGLDGMLPPVSGARAIGEEETASRRPLVRDEVRLASGTETRDVRPGGLARHDEAAPPPSIFVPEARMSNANTLTALVNEPSLFDTPDTQPLQSSIIDPTASTTANGTYTVKAGDSLSSIAKRTVGKDDARTLQAFVAANPKLKPRPNKVLLGEVLKVPDLSDGGQKVAVTDKSGRKGEADKPLSPRGPDASVATRDVRKAPPTARESSGGKALASKARTKMPETNSPKKSDAAKSKAGGKDTASSARTGKSAKQQTQWITVKGQETLTAVAKRVLKDERRWREIQALNGLKSNEKLTTGMKLKVPVDSET